MQSAMEGQEPPSHRRANLGDRLSRAAFLLLALLAAAFPADRLAAASPGPAPDGVTPSVVARFEVAAGTSRLSDLRLKDGRDYFVLIQRMPPLRLDLSSLEAARRTFNETDALKGNLGHAMVGWRCGGRDGLVSQYGETQLQGARMLLSGWGLTTLLSTFTDGYLRGFDYLESIIARKGFEVKAQVLAIEIGPGECAALQAALERYMTDPRQPARRFSMILSPLGFEGGGCLTFAVALGHWSGVLAGLWSALERELPIHAGPFGNPGAPPDLVEPFAPATALAPQFVPLAEVYDEPWQRGPALGHVRIMDPELIYAAIAAVREAAGGPNAFDVSRALPASDPGPRAARAAARRWLENLGPRTLSTRQAPWASIVLVERP
ncbi:MAG: hypothetical protein GC150_11800 [Rhizobiales bacterium]|nr:hypothetical protein [Hyphomicrobiales bacterium]